MRKVRKIFLNLILFILIIILTFSIIFKDQDISQIFNIVKNVKKEFIIIAIICMCIFFCCEAINIGRTLKALGEKTTFLKNLKYALIGFFFSSITPAASGGQPMQIYYMHKDKVSVSSSTLALLVNLTSAQIVTISVALISLCFNYKYMNGILITFFIIGILLNASALALLIISIYSKKLSSGLIKFIIKVLKFFRVKNLESKQEKLENELNKYHDSAIYIRNNKKIMIKIILTTYVQFLLYYSISYWVYRSFGLNSHNIFEILTMQSVLYATVSGIPSPGAVGVSEGGYLAIFETIYSKEMLNGAMLLSRGISFYLFVIISGIIVALNVLIKRKDKKNIERKMNYE